jgi:hypothetical protein
MRALESQWWIIELPEEWDAEQEDESIIISDEDGVGEIVITTMQKEQGDVSDADLKEYMEDLEQQGGEAEVVHVAEFLGYYFSYQEEGDAVREWYLRCNDLLLLVTYSCDLDNAGMDDGAVDDILSTLFIKADAEEDSTTE